MRRIGLLGGMSALVGARGDLLALFTNTMHKVADAITGAVDGPLVPGDTSVPTFDATRLHVERAVDPALAP